MKTQIINLCFQGLKFFWAFGPVFALPFFGFCRSSRLVCRFFSDSVFLDSVFLFTESVMLSLLYLQSGATVFPWTSFITMARAVYMDARPNTRHTYPATTSSPALPVAFTTASNINTINNVKNIT